MKRVSLIIPTYNDEKIIKNTLQELNSFLIREKLNWEILIINDGSTDNILEILKNYKPNFFKIISYKKNKGKGFAIKKGVEKATGDYIAFIDSDLAYSFENLMKILEPLENFDLSIGSRDLSKNKDNISLLRNILGKGFNLISRVILGHRLGDTQCGLKAFRKDIAKDLFSKQILKGFSFDTEILFLAKKMGYTLKLIEANVSKEHLNKKSEVNLLLDPLKMFLDLLKIRLNDLNKKYE